MSLKRAVDGFFDVCATLSRATGTVGACPQRVQDLEWAMECFLVCECGSTAKAMSSRRTHAIVIDLKMRQISDKTS